MRILVTGGTGKVGRELTNYLLKSGNQVVVVSRNPDPAGLPSGVQVLKADFSTPDAATAEITKDVDAVYVNLAAVENTLRAFLSRAVEDGVRLAVLQSAITVEYGGGYSRFAERFSSAEEIVRESGLEWTMLRCSDFASNSTVWIPQIRAGHIVRGAYGSAATSPIHERDIAAMATEAFTHEGHEGKSYPITGPQSLSQSDRVRIIGECIGRNLRFEEISPEQVRAGMLAQGLPKDVPDRMLGYLSTCLAEPGPSTSTIEKALGRPPLTFAQWVTEHGTAFTTKQIRVGATN
jgi:uncharacterized protein YbjT (DUF2867 family)